MRCNVGVESRGVIVSAIIVNHDGERLLRAALASLDVALAESGVQSEVIVVDNASSDGSRAMLAADFPHVRLVALERNVGFPAAVNAGLDRASGTWVLLLNNDATIDRAAIRSILERPIPDDVGTIALEMRFVARPDLVNSAGIGLDALGVAYDRLLGTPVAGPENRRAEVFGACGGAGLFRRSMLEQIGGFDGGIFLYLDDVDVAWRARMAGWRALYEPGAVVWHHHSATTGHGSDVKYFHVGRNRVRLLARNAHRRQLLHHGPAMLAYDLAYIAFVAAADRSLAPLKGRLAGAREWRSLRAEGAALRRPLPLERPQGLRAALRRRRAWREGAKPVSR